MVRKKKEKPFNMREKFTEDVKGINARIERYSEVVPMLKKLLEDFESEITDLSITLDSASITMKDSCDEARWLLACLNYKLPLTKPCHMYTLTYSCHSGTDYNIKWGID